MRTKTLLLAAALGVVGICSSMAQVYSVNAVGFINVDVPAGFSIIANQLDNMNGNKIGDLIKDVPDGTTIYKFTPGSGYSINAFDFGEWGAPDQTLAPGEAAFILNPGTAAIKITFVGEVPQGDLTKDLPEGLSLASSIVPQAAALPDMGFPGADGDVVYFFRGGAYSIAGFDFGEWDPVPIPNVGEGFWVNKTAAATWSRSFSVNN